ncbi:MAG: DUF4294 domain-containing protein [Ferruginibacter sp.]|nr:DUF4294 domain-containing protein [Ferruginibacter sp.]
MSIGQKNTIFKVPLSLLLTFFMCSTSVFAQTQYGINDTIVHEAVIYNGDTIEAKTLENLYLYARLTAAQMSNQAKYNRLRNAVYVTYPYARRAGIIMNDINAHLVRIIKDDDRKNYIHSREKELKTEFTNPLTNLSIYQGKVLMKLINRETGNNCYEIIKEYKGGFNARFYQTIAFFFNSNLKQAYNAATDDAVIEKLVKEVQRMYGYQDIQKPMANSSPM